MTEAIRTGAHRKRHTARPVFITTRLDGVVYGNTALGKTLTVGQITHLHGVTSEITSVSRSEHDAVHKDYQRRLHPFPQDKQLLARGPAILRCRFYG